MGDFVIYVNECSIDPRHEFEGILKGLRDVVGDGEEGRRRHYDVELADEVAAVAVDLAGVDGGDEWGEGHGLSREKREARRTREKVSGRSGRDQVRGDEGEKRERDEPCK